YASLWITICLALTVVDAFSDLVSMSLVCITEKHGSCPKIIGEGLCVEMCSHDSDCPNNQKCCSNGCGHQIAVRPGLSIQVCADNSSHDDQFPARQKCCPTTCGHACS
uniref:WAP domain-containing protein n=1 Tax=Sinocyclocheilus grahami TaxID=75366 RepID=A0A672QND0_SINGR